MENQKNIINPSTQESWDEEYREFGIKVTPDTALYYEIEEFYPHHIITDGKYIGFFKRDGSPFLRDCKWLEVEPLNIALILNRIQNIQPETVEVDDFKGWILPLRESTFAMTMEDVNAYLHNLMFWESMLPAAVSGPIVQRIAWLTDKLYTMRGEQRDSIVIMGDHGLNDLSITTDSTRKIVEYALGSRERTPKEEGNDVKIRVNTRQLQNLVSKMQNILDQTVEYEK